MDSITQATLGAAVGVAVMGRQRPLWQAALTGAVVGTLPDLDVFIDKGDAINDMVLHRAETHAFFWQFLASFPIAYLLSLITRSSGLFKHWWVMTVLVLFTHSMLDGLTIYGTQLALPFTDYPFGMGSLFIIDPLYTLPLLIGLFLTAVKKNENRLRWNKLGLVVSTLYAGWAIGVQAYVTDQVINSPVASKFTESQVLVIPTPFNTVLWRIVLQNEENYYEGFYSLFDPLTRPDESIRFSQYKRGAELDSVTKDFVKANQIRKFSKGFYSMADDGRYISITDLRMGQHPFYAFSFRFAEHTSPPREIKPQQISTRMPIGPALTWLRHRTFGKDLPQPM